MATVWDADIEAYTKPGQDEAAEIVGLLFALGYAVRRCRRRSRGSGPERQGGSCGESGVVRHAPRFTPACSSPQGSTPV